MSNGNLIDINKEVQLSTFGIDSDLDTTHPFCNLKLITSEGEKNLTKKNDRHKILFFKLMKITFDENYPRREVFENVLNTLNNSSFSFIYLIQGTKENISIYLGIKQINDSPFDADDYANEVLSASLLGNFPGSELKELDEKEISSEIFEEINNIRYLSMLFGIPSLNSDADEDHQGMDRLLNTLIGTRFHLIIVCEPESRSKILEIQENTYNIYNKLHLNSKQDTTLSIGKNDTKTKGSSDSKTSNNSRSVAKQSVSKTRTEQKGFSKTTGSSDSTATGSNQGISVRKESINKKLQMIMEYIDEEFRVRLKTGASKGLFKTSIYLGANFPTVLNRLENTCLSLFQGDEPSFIPLWIKRLNNQEKNFVKERLTSFAQIHSNVPERYLPDCILHSLPTSNNESSHLATYMTSRELSLIAGLPIKETCGLPLVENVEFGLNFPIHTGNDAIKIGQLIHHGTILEGKDVSLSKKDLNRHVFISGVTGTGKTTTCIHLLKASKLPFVVLEPVKTEYRHMLSQNPEIEIFTLGDERFCPFRLNPFEFAPTTSIVGHADMLKAAFIAAFDMEAAIPQILEMAIYRCYENYGWNIADDENLFLKDRSEAWRSGGIYFPTLADFSKAIEEVVESKGFDQRLKQDYIGSLKARVDSLMVGSKGLMLNTRKSIDFEGLIDKKVIIEMDSLRDGQDKALLMGLILFRLNEAIRARHDKDKYFKHITLIEEAHRLLEKVPEGISSTKKNGVEMFANLLAEVRKFGECLIIVDQIPNKLIPEVIKNTNTKIIHKLLARDDREAIGDATALNDEQKLFLCKLSVGEVILSTEGLNKPLRIKITLSNAEKKAAAQNESDTYKSELLIHIKNRFSERKESQYSPVFYPEYEMLQWMFPKFISNQQTFAVYQKIQKQAIRLIEEFRKAKEIDRNNKTYRQELVELLEEHKLIKNDLINLITAFWINRMSRKASNSISNDSLKGYFKETHYFIEKLSSPDYPDIMKKDLNLITI